MSAPWENVSPEIHLNVLMVDRYIHNWLAVTYVNRKCPDLADVHRWNMFRLILIIFLFSAQPSLAESVSDMWTEPCEGDLNKVIENWAVRYEVLDHLSMEQRADILRTVGATHALCIDRLIATAEAFEFEPWLKNTLRLSMISPSRGSKKARVRAMRGDCRIWPTTAICRPCWMPPDAS